MKKDQKKSDLPFVLAVVGYVLNVMLLLGVSLGVVWLAFGVKDELDFGAGLMIFLIMMATVGVAVGAGVLGLSIAAIMTSGSAYKGCREVQRRVVTLGVGNLVLMGGLVLLMIILVGILMVGGYYMTDVWTFVQVYGLMQVIAVVAGLIGLMVMVCRKRLEI